MIQQIIHNNGSGNILFTGLPQPAIQQHTYSTSVPARPQDIKEEFQSVHRNLKVKYNLIQDENMRLKTRLQNLTLELQRQEREMEQMFSSLKHQQDQPKLKSNFASSFLVQ